MRREVAGMVTAFAGALLLTGCMMNEEVKVPEPEPVVQDMNYFKGLVDVVEDPAGKSATLSTVKAKRSKAKRLGPEINDNYIRADIDKTTGKVTFWVHNTIVYDTIEGRFHNEVQYTSPKGRKTKKVESADRSIVCKDPSERSCGFVEKLAFGVDEALITKIAKMYQPEKTFLWKYTLKSEADGDYRDGILPAEIAALVERVNEYTENNVSVTR